MKKIRSSSSNTTTASIAYGSLLVWWSLCQSVQAYTLMTNAAVYTVDEEDSWADAIAIDEEAGTIVGVGTEDEIRASLGNEKKRWDLDGMMVLPGFQDAHIHAVEAGINEQICYIREDEDLYQIAATIRRCPNGGKFGGEGWIIAAGIDIATLEEAVFDFEYEFPIDVLDFEFFDTPVVILDNLGHGAVVNSLAMEMVDYDNYILDGTDPPGGIIVRDWFSGNVTGIVLENAQQPFRSAAFPPSEENQQIAYESLLGALDSLAANGITTVSDAGGFWKQAQTEAWDRVEAEGKMTIKASNAFYIYPDIPLSEQATFLSLKYSNDPNKLVRFNQVKIYVDGILSLATSALKEPYSASAGLNGTDELGFEYFPNELENVAETFSDMGFQLHFHVTGDRGAALALDAIESVADPSSGPHRLTHCYLVSEEARARFSELNVVADFQLAPSSLDSEYAEFIAEFIGEDRASQLLPAQEIHDAGGVVTLSSDWDADDLSPLLKLKTVKTAGDGKGIPDLETAIRMMTINPATLLQHSDKTGSIEVGKDADLVILSDNIFAMEPKNIDKAFVVATLMRGKIVYDPDGEFGKPTSDSSIRHLLWVIGVGLLILLALLIL